MATQNLTPEQIRQILDQLSSDVALLRRFVHGDENEKVPLGTPPVNTNSIRRFMMLANDGIAGPVESAKAYRDQARIHAEDAHQAGEAAVKDIVANGGAQVARVESAGNMQDARLYNQGNAQTALILAAGNTQVARVDAAGTGYVQQAQSEAERAKSAAALAVGMSGDAVVPAGRGVAGIVSIGDGIQVDSNGRISVQRDMRDYIIPVTDASGIVNVLFKEIGHPEQNTPCNPIINLLTSSQYRSNIVHRDEKGFTVQIYNADGIPGADISRFVEMGTIKCGDGAECGQAIGKANVSLLVSLPV